MQGLKSLATYLRLLLFGLWGAIGAILEAASILAFLASFFVPQLEPTRWVAFGVLALAVLVSGFRIWQSEFQRRIALEKELQEAKSPKFDAQSRQFAEQAWSKLAPEEKEAVRLLFLHGDLSERQGLQYLQAQGMAANWGSIYYGIAERTNFVQRVVPGRQRDEHVHGYTGPYTINPKFRPLLEELVQSPAS